MTSDTNPSNRCVVPSSIPPDSQHSIWTSLANDTGAFVLIIDEHGTVLCCNDLVNDTLGADVAPLQGKPVTVFCSEGVAAECAMVINRSIQENAPVNFTGMCQGVVTRSIARPLPAAGGEPRCAIKIVRPMNGNDVLERDRGEGIWLTATSFDLGRLANLTSREMEVLRLIGESMTTAEIAERLHRSVKTIEWHRVSLGSKLEAGNRVELARIAVQAGLQFLDEETFAKICKLSSKEHAAQPF